MVKISKKCINQTLTTGLVVIFCFLYKNFSYLIYIKQNNLYLSLYHSSITDTEHSPNYTAFGLPLTLQVR